MSTLIDCPACQRQLRVPEEFQGRSVRCPTCGETFRAPESAGSPAPPLDVALQLELDEPTPAPPTPPAPEPSRPAQEAPQRRSRDMQDEEGDGDRRRRRRDFEPCPRCDEDVRRGAVVCPYCGLDLEEQGDGYTRRARVHPDAEPHRGGTVQILGILSLVLANFLVLPLSLPLGIAAWVMGRHDLQKMDDGEMDPDGRKKTKDGWLCGLIGTVLTLIYAALLVGLFSLIAVRESALERAHSATPEWDPGKTWSLSGPGVRPVLKRGQATTISVTVSRGPRFRGDVTVSVNPRRLPAGLSVEPDEIDVPAWQLEATFRIVARDHAVPGDYVVRFTAEDDERNRQTLDVPISVTR